MRCSFCNMEFNEETAPRGCKNCSLVTNCGLIKCPNCGYEMPPTPKLIKKILMWGKKNETTGKE